MLRVLELLKTHLKTRQQSQRELEGKVTLDFVLEKTENAIARGANEL